MFNSAFFFYSCLLRLRITLRFYASLWDTRNFTVHDFSRSIEAVKLSRTIELTLAVKFYTQVKIYRSKCRTTTIYYSKPRNQRINHLSSVTVFLSNAFKTNKNMLLRYIRTFGTIIYHQPIAFSTRAVNLQYLKEYVKKSNVSYTRKRFFLTLFVRNTETGSILTRVHISLLLLGRPRSFFRFIRK